MISTSPSRHHRNHTSKQKRILHHVIMRSILEKRHPPSSYTLSSELLWGASAISVFSAWEKVAALPTTK